MEKKGTIGREAKWTAIILGIVSLIGQQFVLNSVKDALLPAIENTVQPGVASIGDYFTIGAVFLASAPLAVAIAIIYVLTVEGALPADMRGVSISVVVLGIGLLVGNAFGFKQVEWVWYSNGGTPLGMLGGILQAYLSTYGIVLFISSTVVGVFLGRAYRILATDY